MAGEYDEQEAAQAYAQARAETLLEIRDQNRLLQNVIALGWFPALIEFVDDPDAPQHSLGAVLARTGAIVQSPATLVLYRCVFVQPDVLGSNSQTIDLIVEYVRTNHLRSCADVLGEDPRATIPWGFMVVQTFLEPSTVWRDKVEPLARRTADAG